MKKTVACLVLMIVAATTEAAVDTRFMQGLGDSRYFHIESKVVGRGYHIYVMLPHGYDETSSTRYPTVYVLDGGGLFPLMTSYYRYLRFGGEVPDTIIVGISYGGDTFEEGNYRSADYTAASAERDYWGGATRFQKFLSDELIPVIEDDYKSDASRRIIFGQSIGGQFVLYTALTSPDLFWGHIASNPALHRNLPFFLTQHVNSEPDTERSRLFVADGTLNDAEFREPSLRWIKHWSAIEDKPWVLEATDLEGHSHMSAPPAAFRQGMRWLFALANE
jgi:predicted alpha/beta superfamily hydrolase